MRSAIGLYVFAVGSCLAFALYHHHLREQRSHWQSVYGVASAPKLTRRGNRHDLMFSVSYEVEGRTYRTARQPVRAGMEPGEGDMVLVYYDPADPNRSEFRSDLDDRSSWGSVAVVAVIGALVLFGMWRRRRGYA